MTHPPQDKLNKYLETQMESLSQFRGYRLFSGLLIFGLLICSQIFKGFSLELIAIFGVFPFFVFFLNKTRSKENFIAKIKARIDFYSKQSQFSQGNFTNSFLPEEMSDPNLSRDLDLGALLTSLNFCFSKQGLAKLDQWLCQKLDLSKIKERSQRIETLAKENNLLKKIQSIPSTHLIDFERAENEINRSFFEPSMGWRWFIPISWVALVILLLLHGPSLFLKISLFAYVASMLFYLGKTKFLFSRLQDLHKDLDSLKNRINLLERLAKKIDFAPSLKQQTASRDTRSISRLISLMSLRTNPILFYILNMILPWDFLLAEFCERARKNLALHFNTWKDEVIEIEVTSCFANLIIYHEAQFPTLADKTFLDFQDLSHPLLNQSSVVKNSFSSKDGSIFIITGSNMSGKSTFLRAVGINLCLANIGAPVFASNFAFTPMKISTCIRVSDSLRDGQSYFYAEVQRMKFILQSAKKEPLFFLIDEPLRGTNNKERLIGNQSYLNQILKSNGRGFICTHDLELTKLADSSEQITNYHFSEQWENQDLHFDYKIKAGPSQSTNALKILEKEGLYLP